MTRSVLSEAGELRPRERRLRSLLRREEGPRATKRLRTILLEHVHFANDSPLSDAHRRRPYLGCA